MKPTPKMQAAFEAFDKRIKAWQPLAKDGASMRKMFTRDRKNMRAVLSACRKGDWGRAAELAGHLDTIVRDEIPDYLWNVMNEDI
jgi:hypothetical protein